jgi:hypothetical protein
LSKPIDIFGIARLYSTRVERSVEYAKKGKTANTLAEKINLCICSLTFIKTHLRDSKNTALKGLLFSGIAFQASSAIRRI